MFCRSLFVLLYFFFWLLCCLFFFDIQILLAPLVSSNSYVQNKKIALEFWISMCKIKLSKKLILYFYTFLVAKVAELRIKNGYPN